MAKKRIEVLSQIERNELGAAAAEAQRKTEIEAWNSALSAAVTALSDGLTGKELVAADDVIGFLKGLMKGEEE